MTDKPTVAQMLADTEAVEGVKAWLSAQEQTINVGKAGGTDGDVLIQSSAGWLMQLLTAVGAEVPFWNADALAVAVAALKQVGDLADVDADDRSVIVRDALAKIGQASPNAAPPHRFYFFGDQVKERRCLGCGVLESKAAPRCLDIFTARGQAITQTSAPVADGQNLEDEAHDRDNHIAAITGASQLSADELDALFTDPNAMSAVVDGLEDIKGNENVDIAVAFIRQHVQKLVKRDPEILADRLRDIAASNYDVAMNFGISRDNFERTANEAARVAMDATVSPSPSFDAWFERYYGMKPRRANVPAATLAAFEAGRESAVVPEPLLVLPEAVDEVNTEWGIVPVYAAVQVFDAVRDALDKVIADAKKRLPQ